MTSTLSQSMLFTDVKAQAIDNCTIDDAATSAAD